MLASGVGHRDIFEYYVEENNHSMHPSKPWTYDDLDAAADKPLTWVFPVALMAGFGAGFLAFMWRRRRGRGESLIRPAEASGDRVQLSSEDKLRLEDELDVFDI